ncbi:cytochrome C [Geomesophilobacter sediminis]|uniref:Cytochrome C n=1 Tax=Geomesophilobacter sediminis TaxID=2798584 RepID=A0A8J7LV55_9BACT|nr:cytochrome C [Geomesophilobacter sediminis]MBJ6725399.1 cytochrome C [Geomesophilobacter sediminis]
MQISKKDWMFIGVIAVVIIIFVAISGEEKTKRVPLDDKHKPSYDLFNKTQSKMEVDKGCPACHFEPGGVPFPPKHPVKPKDGPMRCLFCHKLKVSGLQKQ